MGPQTRERQEDYVSRLQKCPERGIVHVISVNNRQSIPIEVQIEPTGAMAPPLAPGDCYEIVLQTPQLGMTTIDVREGWISVWVDEGQVFHRGVSVAY
jgi:hypothetical protein